VAAVAVVLLDNPHDLVILRSGDCLDILGHGDEMMWPK
jgi:hypothetical protein